MRIDFKESGFSWVSLPSTGGTIATLGDITSDSWQQSVRVDVNASTLRERGDAYAATILLRVNAPADMSQDSLFTVPVLLFVTSEAVAAYSGWKLDGSGERCSRDPAGTRTNMLRVILGVLSEVTFYSCGKLPVLKHC